jgi:5-(carboxyamino)imidazole ribonucleotide synthase
VRVGIVGGGQLGRMLSLAGHQLGITCITLDPVAYSASAQVGPAIVGAFDDEGSLAALAAASDVATYEFENVPAESVRFLAARIPAHPPPEALVVAQDRVAEKQLFADVGLEAAGYAPVGDLDDLDRAIDAVGLPSVLKTRRLGYDGKGQAVIHDRLLSEDAWRAVGQRPSILEAHIPFDRELSIIGVRGSDGATRFYPLVQNEHRDGILRVSRSAAQGMAPDLQGEAERHAAAIMERLAYVGVLAIELFERDGGLLGNEMAPRVHNSGHWTIEGAATSQFENHLRAVAGLPLGPTTTGSHVGMVNVIGSEPDLAGILGAVPEAHVHRYGKQPREGRKLGHITVVADDAGDLDEKLLQVKSFSPDVSP